MAYDAEVVRFTSLEHEMAAKLDHLVEALSDGPDVSDISVLLEGVSLLKYLAQGGSRALTVKRLLTLAVMLERDNDYLNTISDNEGT